MRSTSLEPYDVEITFVAAKPPQLRGPAKPPVELSGYTGSKLAVSPPSKEQ